MIHFESDSQDEAMFMMRLCTKNRKISCHSGAPRSGEPGTHKHRPLEYGFRARSLRPRPGMTRLFVQRPAGGARGGRRRIDLIEKRANRVTSPDNRARLRAVHFP